MTELKIEKRPQIKDSWHVHEEYMYAFVEVEHSDGFVHKIVLNSSGGIIELTNFDVRVLLRILKEGNYKLEGDKR